MPSPDVAQLWFGFGLISALLYLISVVLSSKRFEAVYIVAFLSIVATGPISSLFALCEQTWKYHRRDPTSEGSTEGKTQVAADS